MNIPPGTKRAFVCWFLLGSGLLGSLVYQEATPLQTLMPDSSPLLGPQLLEGGHHSSFICVCLVFSKDSAWKPSIPNTHGKRNKILAPLVAGVLAQGADHSFLGLGEEGGTPEPQQGQLPAEVQVHFLCLSHSPGPGEYPNMGCSRAGEKEDHLACGPP